MALDTSIASCASFSSSCSASALSDAGAGGAGWAPLTLPASGGCAWPPAVALALVPRVARRLAWRRSTPVEGAASRRQEAGFVRGTHPLISDDADTVAMAYGSTIAERPS